MKGKVSVRAHSNCPTATCCLIHPLLTSEMFWAAIFVASVWLLGLNIALTNVALTMLSSVCDPAVLTFGNICHISETTSAVPKVIILFLSCRGTAFRSQLLLTMNHFQSKLNLEAIPSFWEVSANESSSLSLLDSYFITVHGSVVMNAHSCTGEHHVGCAWQIYCLSVFCIWG